MIDMPAPWKKVNRIEPAANARECHGFFLVNVMLRGRFEADRAETLHPFR
jgi:hypothetical protein